MEDLITVFCRLNKFKERSILSLATQKRFQLYHQSVSFSGLNMFNDSLMRILNVTLLHTVLLRCVWFLMIYRHFKNLEAQLLRFKVPNEPYIWWSKRLVNGAIPWQRQLSQWIYLLVSHAFIPLSSFKFYTWSPWTRSCFSYSIIWESKPPCRLLSGINYNISKYSDISRKLKLSWIIWSMYSVNVDHIHKQSKSLTWRRT